MPTPPEVRPRSPSAADAYAPAELGKGTVGLEPRLAIIRAYTVIALVYCAASTLLFQFVARNDFLAVVHLAGFLVVGGNYLLLRRNANVVVATHAILGTGTTVVVSLFGTGGWGGTGFLWPFAYLPYAFFLAEPRAARLWVAILFGACLAVVGLGFAGVLPLAYGPVQTTNYFAALLVFTVCMFLFKSAVSRYARVAQAGAESIAQQRIARLAQEQEIERLDEINRFKTGFLNSAAHELNTPLTPLKLQLHMLQGEASANLTPIQVRGVGILARNVERLQRLVRDLLDAARLQSANLTLHEEPTDVALLIEETIESFQPQAAERQVSLASGPLPPLLIHADPTRLSQVLYNLVSNALKFTPPGGKVIVDAHATAQSLIVQVTDTGAGLSPQQAERLFQPFTQVHAYNVAKVPGTGLGLYISRGLIELHGGTLWATSAGPDAGSTFTFEIPLSVEARKRPVNVALKGPGPPESGNLSIDRP